MFRLALVYESGKRYIVPFDIAKTVLKLEDKDVKRLEEAVKKEVVKG